MATRPIWSGLGLAGTVLLSLAAQPGRCQGVAAPDESPAVASFLQAAEAESKKGSYLFYAQSFVDKQNERVTYGGSVYGVLRNVKLDGCAMSAEIQIVDLFSGTVGGNPIGQKQDVDEYTVTVPLTRDLAEALKVVQARPEQLSRSRHTVCREEASCLFTWLRMDVKGKVIHETQAVNHVIHFDGYTDHLVVPVSSVDAGNELIKDLRSVADSGCL